MQHASLPEVTMSSIGSYLKGDFAQCNKLFYTTCEHLLAHADAPAALAMQEFATAMERHMQMEERIVFSAFEAKRGREGSPTRRLCTEQMAIRDSVQRMRLSLEARHGHAFLLHADGLRLLLWQHAHKENFELLPVIEQALAPRHDELLDAMAHFDGKAA